MKENTAEDFSDKLDEARSQNSGQFVVPKNGTADNYDKSQIADNYGHQENKDRLEDARERNSNETNTKSSAKIFDKTKDIAKSLKSLRATSLLKQIDFIHDLPFAAAFGVAMLKDLLDLVGVGSLPAIGTVITICVSAFIGAMLLWEGVGNRKKAVAKRWIRRFGVLGVGTAVEFLFGANFLPVETFTVFLLYTMTLKDRVRSNND